jgi:hypothetical protein
MCWSTAIKGVCVVGISHSPLILGTLITIPRIYRLFYVYLRRMETTTEYDLLKHDSTIRRGPGREAC